MVRRGRSGNEENKAKDSEEGKEGRRQGGKRRPCQGGASWRRRLHPPRLRGPCPQGRGGGGAGGGFNNRKLGPHSQGYKKPRHEGEAGDDPRDTGGGRGGAVEPLLHAESFH